VRIISWNIENLLPELGQLSDVFVRLGEPDVLCLQEVRIPATDHRAIASLERALPGYRAYASLNRDARNATFRGGRAYGVVTYVSEALGRVEAQIPGWDLEGRFVLTRVANLSIGNVYAVNGTGKPYWDHEQSRFDGDRHAFKRRFQRRVLEEGRRLAALGSVVLAGDWNVSQTKLDTYPRLRNEPPHVRARAEFQDLVEAAGLVDVHRHLFPKERAYSWFNRRAEKLGRLDAARVDFMLVSKNLLECVDRVAILGDPGFRIRTDHAPVILDLSS
jgi:exodeoxyribonuclease III